MGQEGEDKTQEKMLDYVENAHAMEQSILRQLDAMISSTDDPEIVEVLRHHKGETQQHEQRLRERLDALGRGTSARKEAQTIARSLRRASLTRCAATRPARMPGMPSLQSTWR